MFDPLSPLKSTLVIHSPLFSTTNLLLQVTTHVFELITISLYWNVRFMNTKFQGLQRARAYGMSRTFARISETESFHFSRLAAMDLTSSRNSYPVFFLSFFLSFSTVRLQLVFGLPLLLFPSDAQVIAVLQSLFWSCISICPIMSHLLIYAASPFYSESTR